MKIAFDYQTFSLQRFGGISRYQSALAETLAMAGHEVNILAGLHQNDYLNSLKWCNVRGFHQKHPPKIGRIIRGVNHLYSEFFIKCMSPDIVHETYYASYDMHCTNAVRICTIHDMIHEKFPTSFSFETNTTDRKLKACNRVDHIIAVSHNTKADLIDLFGIPESKITVIHHGIDVNFFMQSVQNPRTLSSPFLLFVGSRGGYKNFGTFLQSCARSKLIKKHHKIVCFGGGSFNREEKLLIEKLGFEAGAVIQISGTDAILRSLYTEAECFVYPSLYEGFGLPILEAMAAGCPVATSNTSSIPEVANDAVVYFDPRSVESIRSSIESLLDSHSLRAKIIQKGFANVKSYTWHQCARKNVELYSKIL